MVSKKGLAAREVDGAGVVWRGIDPGSCRGSAAVVERREKAAFGR
jgi:hypothetical protein